MCEFWFIQGMCIGEKKSTGAGTTEMPVFKGWEEKDDSMSKSWEELPVTRGKLRDSVVAEAVHS